MTYANPMHMARSPSWETPTEWVELARGCLGSIDFDPASTVQANKRVLARGFATPTLDGLNMLWAAPNVFLNPPGNGWRDWLYKLHEELNEGRCRQAFYLGYSLEQLRNVSSTEWNFTDRDVIIAVPHKRIRFISAETGLPGGSPTHGNFMMLVLEPARIPNARLLLEPVANIWQPCP